MWGVFMFITDRIKGWALIRIGLHGATRHRATWVAGLNDYGDFPYLVDGASTAGDVNGDGFSDIIVSCYMYSNVTNGGRSCFCLLRISRGSRSGWYQARRKSGKC